MSNRAYSILEVKAIDDKTRSFSGWATTPEVDRVMDTIDPMGATFKNPIVLLHQHNHEAPIGSVKLKNPTKKGIEFEASIPFIEEAGLLKDRVDTAWGEIKAGLVRAVSIGFAPKKYAYRESGGIDFQEIEIYELSTVSVPANAGAMITQVKAIDRALREAAGVPEPEIAIEPAASGTVQVVTPPGVSGKSKSVSLKPKEGEKMKTIAEQITALEAKRAAHAGRMEEIMQKSVDTDRTTEATEQEEFDTLDTEVKAIDADLKRFRALETMKGSAAKAVSGTTSVEASAARDTLAPVKVKAAKLPVGIEFARLARAKALAYIDHEPARDIAKRLYGEDSPVVGLLTKDNVVAGSSVSGTWAADLVGAETAVYADFAEFLRPMTILGKFGSNGIPSLTTVPFRTALIVQTGGGTGYWVGEGKPKPLTAFNFDRSTLDELKVAAISVVTEELLRKSSPSADGLLRDSLAAAVVERIDQTFIDPAIPADPGVSPASITNAVSAIASTGNDADSIREDLRQLWGTFIAANNPPTTAVYIMSSMTALALSMMVNPLGQPEFPGLTMNGGTFGGVPVITSEYLGDVTAGGFVALVNARDIYFGDEGGVAIDMSREASLQMLDNPTNASVTPTATAMVSMWQTNSIAFRAERVLNWKKRRTSAVALLDEVNWGQPGS